ncbi:MAG: magnesium transporter [Eubacteriales bacterium]|nr:magnesium transporter [Eubacteriales bacterium]
MKKNIPLEETAILYPDYETELIEIVHSNLSPKLLAEKILRYHENDIAAVLERLDAESRLKLYNLLDAETLSNILEYVEDTRTYFSELGVRKQVEILSHMEAETAVDYLRQLSREERNLLIDLMDAESRHDLFLIGSFDEDEIGSKMTTNYIEIRLGLNIRQAMRELISQAGENDNISTIYVVDTMRVFYGAIDLKDLIVARETDDLHSLITTSYPYVYASEQIEDCIERLKDYSEDSIPVLDNDNKLLGVLTAQDLVEVVDSEMGEDYARLAGLSAEEDLREPLRQSMKKRLPWLIILLVLGMVVSSVVGLFEGVVAQLTLIICFQSLILDMAGNVGTQSLAVTIRVLMDEQVNTKQKFLLIAKEARVGLSNGLLLGLLAFVCIGGYIFLFKGKPLPFAFAVSACIGAALLLSMVISSVAGTAIPILFKKMHIDPAVASGPLITTINDLVAVVTYYGLTWLFLIELLHLTD